MHDAYRPLKDAFGRFATGVAIAACHTPEGKHAALTVNSFTSVSLSPPLVLWCIETKALSYDAFMAADNYSVTILRADQQAISNRFARYSPSPFNPDEFETWNTGAPILKERLAALDCTVRSRHTAGDHVVLVGEVVRFESQEGAPLIYFASQYLTSVHQDDNA